MVGSVGDKASPPPSLVSPLAAEATTLSRLSSLSRSLQERRWLAADLFAQDSGLWLSDCNGFLALAPCFFRLGVGGVIMAAPLLLRRRLGYFRWFQCFRVGAAVAFPTVVASASQSSAELEQVRGKLLDFQVGERGWAAPGCAGPGWLGSRPGRGLTVL